MVKIKLGLTAGDPGGIGARIIAKLLAARDLYRYCEPFIFGPEEHILNYLKKENVRIRVIYVNDKICLTSVYGSAWLVPGKTSSKLKIRKGKIAKENGQLAVQYLQDAVEYCRQKRIDGIVTGPVSKEAVAKSLKNFSGHTEFLQKATKCKHVVMFFSSPLLKVGLLTRHVPLGKVPQLIKGSEITKTLNLMDAHSELFGVKKARIAVCGLNPHAGENGLLGSEDKKIVAPAVKRAQKQGIRASGPWSADTVFTRTLKGDFDMVLALYHDQGLAPFKAIAFEDGVQTTLGLPFVRTSPDHGPAFDKTDSAYVSVKSFSNAVQLASLMIKRKKKNPKSKHG